jgi:hypothetical protein
MHRIELVSVLASVGLLLVIVELVRRRALSERYSLLWLLTALVLIGLSMWHGALDVVAWALGIYYPPSALMLIAVGFVLVILLHYSLVISKLTDRNKELAQRYAMLQWRVSRLEQAKGEPQEPTRRTA